MFPKLGHRYIYIGAKTFYGLGAANFIVLLDKLDTCFTGHAAKTHFLVYIISRAAESELVILYHLVHRAPVVVKIFRSQRITGSFNGILAYFQTVCTRIKRVVYERPVAKEPS